jgi:protein gp37
MENSHIEWTDNTFNIAEGCMKVSEGCKNCYAETRDIHWHGGCHWGPGSSRKMMSEHYWNQPKKWDLQALANGIKVKVFCSSLCDVFENHKDLYEPRKRLFDLIDNTPNLIWQLLTKRPENITMMVPKEWYLNGWPPNVWIGTTVENQKAAEDRIPHLLRIPAKVRFLSCEPLLGPINITQEKINYSVPTRFYGDIGIEWTDPGPDFIGIDWVICGGESGYNARPLFPAWAGGLRDQCEKSKTPFFFKQWGQFLPKISFDADIKGNVIEYLKVGKKVAGNLLDGIEHKAFPRS